CARPTNWDVGNYW
nr:immunoglobulin heavy chain junction region [Mus musculus]MBK4188512.1 immunoglobulin heavy chain junction region [Mus musculus]